MKIDSDVYTIKSGNTFRTNTVTEEHPVLITKPKFHSDKVQLMKMLLIFLMSKLKI